jgi:hypothetical protein
VSAEWVESLRGADEALLDKPTSLPGRPDPAAEDDDGSPENAGFERGTELVRTLADGLLFPSTTK